MDPRLNSVMISEALSRPLAEIRQLIQEYADGMEVSREEAIQIMIDAILIENNRTVSEIVGGFAGVDRNQGRIILNRAESWIQSSMRELRGSGDAMSEVDAISTLIEKFAEDVALSRESAERILNIAREEAAKHTKSQ
jgi:hypothetical protein